MSERRCRPLRCFPVAISWVVSLCVGSVVAAHLRIPLFPCCGARRLIGQIQVSEFLVFRPETVVLVLWQEFSFSGCWFYISDAKVCVFYNMIVIFPVHIYLLLYIYMHACGSRFYSTPKLTCKYPSPRQGHPTILPFWCCLFFNFQRGSSSPSYSRRVVGKT